MLKYKFFCCSFTPPLVEFAVVCWNTVSLLSGLQLVLGKDHVVELLVLLPKQQLENDFVEHETKNIHMSMLWSHTFTLVSRRSYSYTLP